jgi:hypothetical protein
MTVAFAYQRTWTNFLLERTESGHETVADSFITPACRDTTDALDGIEKTASNPKVVLVASRQSQTLAKSRQRQQQRMPMALEYRERNGHPVEALARLMASLIVDENRWQEIVEEPYG